LANLEASRQQNQELGRHVAQLSRDCQASKAQLEQALAQGAEDNALAVRYVLLRAPAAIS